MQVVDAAKKTQSTGKDENKRSAVATPNGNSWKEVMKKLAKTNP